MSWHSRFEQSKLSSSSWSVSHEVFFNSMADCLQNEQRKLMSSKTLNRNQGSRIFAINETQGDKNDFYSRNLWAVFPQLGEEFHFSMKQRMRFSWNFETSVVTRLITLVVSHFLRLYHWPQVGKGLKLFLLPAALYLLLSISFSSEIMFATSLSTGQMLNAFGALWRLRLRISSRRETITAHNIGQVLL